MLRKKVVFVGYPAVGRDHRADETLARAAAAGSEPALQVVIGRVSGKLRSIAWRLTHDYHEAQDLCQEALAKATSAHVLRRYRGTGPLDGYLVNVGVHAMLNARRTRPVRQWRETDIVADPPERVAVDDPAPSTRELDPALRRALEKLAPRARLIVLLIAVGDLSYEEAARLTELPLGTVKSTYSRACATLRGALAGWPADVSHLSAA